MVRAGAVLASCSAQPGLPQPYLLWFSACPGWPHPSLICSRQSLAVELGHSPALVNKLLCCPECVILPEGCCFLAPHHHLCNTSQGGFCPFSFFFFGLYRKSLDQGQKGGRQAAPGSGKPHSIPQWAAWEGQDELPLRQSWFPPFLQHRSVFIRWDGCPQRGRRDGGASAAVCAGGGHRLPSSLSICFQPANSCVLRSVLTQLSWHHARCRARRYFKRLLLLLGWPSLSGTVQGQPAPGAKRSLSNLEGF